MFNSQMMSSLNKCYVIKILPLWISFSYVLIIDTCLTEPHRNCIYEGGASNYHLEIINKKTSMWL